jgi:PKD repeat protein
MSIAADFYTETTEGVGTLSVQFVDASTGGADTWLWSFGDEEYSSGHNPIHEYTEPGYYTVTLTASYGGDSNTVTKFQYIKIRSIYTYDFAPEPDSKAYFWGDGTTKKKEIGVEISAWKSHF